MFSKLSEIFFELFIPDPDPGVKKAPDPGSGSATLVARLYCFFAIGTMTQSSTNIKVFFEQLDNLQLFVIITVGTILKTSPARDSKCFGGSEINNFKIFN
jgi:hypothetical protein